MNIPSIWQKLRKDYIKFKHFISRDCSNISEPARGLIPLNAARLDFHTTSSVISKSSIGLNVKPVNNSFWHFQYKSSNIITYITRFNVNLKCLSERGERNVNDICKFRQIICKFCLFSQEQFIDLLHDFIIIILMVGGCVYQSSAQP